jgi:hypothetical protein
MPLWIVLVQNQHLFCRRFRAQRGLLAKRLPLSLSQL